MFLRNLLLSTGLIILLGSCQKDTAESSFLDASLLTVLESASADKGIDYFKFPAADHFDAIPQDPRNPITASKVSLGQLLFHETALAIHPKKNEAAGTYSCATCHFAQAGFQACKAQGIGEGGLGFGLHGEARERSQIYPDDIIDVQPIRTPSAMNGAFQEVTLWNGQFGATGLNKNTESQWKADTPIETNFLGYQGLETQAIAGLNVHRLGVPVDLLNAGTYKSLFAQAFPNTSQTDRYSVESIGLAIAAFERTLMATQAPFQQWLQGNHHAMTDQQKQGAILFFGKANCVSCHTGPALNEMAFYALGMNDLYEASSINASPLDPANKGRGGFTGLPKDNYTFKVPQLYNLIDSPFYGHGASFESLEAVVRYKNNAKAQNSVVPVAQLATNFVPLGLTEDEISQLVAFLSEGLRDPDLIRYAPSSLPSGNCFPNNDVISKVDMGCGN